MTGVIFFTVTLVVLTTGLKLLVSFGVKVTLCEAVPGPGFVAGLVKAKLPAGVAEPPVRVESARVWPKIMSPAAGQVVTIGIALPTVNDC